MYFDVVSLIIPSFSTFKDKSIKNQICVRVHKALVVEQGNLGLWNINHDPEVP